MRDDKFSNRENQQRYRARHPEEAKLLNQLSKLQTQQRRLLDPEFDTFCRQQDRERARRHRCRKRDIKGQELYLEESAELSEDETLHEVDWKIKADNSDPLLKMNTIKQEKQLSPLLDGYLADTFSVPATTDSERQLKHVAREAVSPVLRTSSSSSDTGQQKLPEPRRPGRPRLQVRRKKRDREQNLSAQARWRVAHPGRAALVQQKYREKMKLRRQEDQEYDAHIRQQMRSRKRRHRRKAAMRLATTAAGEGGSKAGAGAGLCRGHETLELTRQCQTLPSCPAERTQTNNQQEENINKNFLVETETCDTAAEPDIGDLELGEVRDCCVCGDKASGLHYGVYTCGG